MIRILSVLLFLTVLFSCDSSVNKKETEAKTNESPDSQTILIKSYPNLSKKYMLDKRAKIKTFFKENELLEDFNGSFLVAKNGQIIYEYYAGFSNFEKKQKIDRTTALHLASISKVFTATAIFRLIDQGKLRLDDNVINILPEFPYDSISVRMLLNHRSGVPNYAYFASRKDVWDQSVTLKNKDILNLLAKNKFPLDFMPNSKFVYNNSNYALLALIIEKVSEMSYSKAMEKLVFLPIGMKNTFVFDISKDSISVSQSYKSTFEKVPFDFLDAIYGDKNCYSTPRDIMKYDLAIKEDKFVSKELKKEIFKGYSYEKQGVKNYGLGIRLKEWSAEQILFYHQGWWHGNTSSYVTLKKENVVIIGLSNRYSKKIYQTMRLAALFGDYPYELGSNKIKKLQSINPSKE